MITLWSVFDYKNKKEEISKLSEEINQNPNFWDDVQKAQSISKHLSGLEKCIKSLEDLNSSFYDMQDMMEFVEEDAEYLYEAKALFEKAKKQTESLKIQVLLSGKYDNAKAIMTINAGAGGTEAQDWADILYRMYSMFAEKNGYKLEVLDFVNGDVAGIKSITFSLQGDYAYGYLKSEMGVHRLVRISPFDSNARRHTSFASVEVVPEIEQDNTIEVRSEDIRIDTYRASGAGGQHINKTDSAIRITHFPSGIVVTCQNERSQIQNREKAMQVLKSKLLKIKLDEEEKNLQNMKGEVKKIEWGSQIRSYVFCPYTLVKDHRTNFENTNIQSVIDGDLMPFIEAYLKNNK